MKNKETKFEYRLRCMKFDLHYKRYLVKLKNLSNRKKKDPSFYFEIPFLPENPRYEKKTIQLKLF